MKLQSEKITKTKKEKKMHKKETYWKKNPMNAWQKEATSVMLHIVHLYVCIYKFINIFSLCVDWNAKDSFLLCYFYIHLFILVFLFKF